MPLVQRPQFPGHCGWSLPSCVPCTRPFNKHTLTGGCKKSVQPEVSAVPSTRPRHGQCPDVAVHSGPETVNLC